MTAAVTQDLRHIDSNSRSPIYGADGLLESFSNSEPISFIPHPATYTDSPKTAINRTRYPQLGQPSMIDSSEIPMMILQRNLSSTDSASSPRSTHARKRPQVLYQHLKRALRQSFCTVSSAWPASVTFQCEAADAGVTQQPRPVRSGSVAFYAAAQRSQRETARTGKTSFFLSES